MQIQQRPYFQQNNQLKRNVNNSPSFGININVEGLSSIVHHEISTSPLIKAVDAAFENASIVELKGKHFWQMSTTAIDLGKLPEGATCERYLRLGQRSNEILKALRDKNALERHLATPKVKAKQKPTFKERMKNIFDKLLVDE